MKRITGFFIGTLCGAAAGAAVALLLTPTSGRELQAQAREQFEAMAARIRKRRAGITAPQPPRPAPNA